MHEMQAVEEVDNLKGAPDQLGSRQHKKVICSSIDSSTIEPKLL